MTGKDRIAHGIGFCLMAATLALALQFVVPVRVSGGSMRPTLQPGDLVLVGKRTRPSVGDVALLSPTGRGLVLHRLVGREESGMLRTKGDANDIADFHLAEEAEIEGKVVAVVPVGQVLRRWRGQ